jgi:hypothetical protein
MIIISGAKMSIHLIIIRKNLKNPDLVNTENKNPQIVTAIDILTIIVSEIKNVRW